MRIVYFLLILSIAVLLYLMFVVTHQTFGWENCHKYCKPIPTPTPTVSCTPIPTLTPQLSSTPNAGASATPMPLPSPTGVSSPPSTPSNGGSGSPPVIYGPDSSTHASGSPTCNIPFAPPILQGWAFGPILGSLTFSWWNSIASGITEQSLVYGYSPTVLPYGVILPSLSSNYTINDLIPGKIVWAEVWAFKNGCMERSGLLDP